MSSSTNFYPLYYRSQIGVIRFLMEIISSKDNVSCSDSNSFKIYNESGNAELLVTAFINKF